MKISGSRMSDSTPFVLKSRDNAATMERNRRGKRPRTLRIEWSTLPLPDASATNQFQSAFDALLVRAIRRGLESGTLVRNTDGAITRGNS